MRKFRAIIEMDGRHGTLEETIAALKSECENHMEVGHWADVISVEEIQPEKKETSTTGSLSATCGPRSLHPSAYE